MRKKIFNLLPDYLKHYIKKYLRYYLVKDKLSKNETDQQKKWSHNYQLAYSKGELSSLSSLGHKVFSQYEEDGLLLYLFSLLNFSKSTFIEFGSDDGINSNSANLAIHHGFSGLFIDGNKKALERGAFFYKKYVKNSNPIFKNAFVKTDNINTIIAESGLTGEIGLLSIDIDGNDYWIWKAIDVVNPQIVIIETHNEFGMNDIIVPYDSKYEYPGIHPDYHGASPVAMNKLANSKGYRLVGANKLGFNFIFLRNDLIPELEECSVESCLQHPSNKSAQKRFTKIRDHRYIQDDL